MNRVRAKKTNNKLRKFLFDDSSLDTFEPEYLKIDAAGRLFLRGVDRVFSCGKEEIVFQVRKKKLIIRGKDLCLSVLSKNETVITGDPVAVIWESVVAE